MAQSQGCPRPLGLYCSLGWILDVLSENTSAHQVMVWWSEISFTRTSRSKTSEVAATISRQWPWTWVGSVTNWVRECSCRMLKNLVLAGSSRCILTSPVSNKSAPWANKRCNRVSSSSMNLVIDEEGGRYIATTCNFEDDDVLLVSIKLRYSNVSKVSEQVSDASKCEWYMTASPPPRFLSARGLL